VEVAAPISARHFKPAGSIAALYVILDVGVPDRSTVIDRTVEVIVAIIAAISVAFTAKGIA
jgi:hypothetical protein